MNDCKDVFAALSEYLDGDLPPDVCERMAAHIEKCAPCVEFVDSLKRAIELCRGYRGAEAPAPIPGEARERLREAYRRMMEAQ